MKTAEDILKEKNREMIFISPKQTIREAIRLMTENKIGAILVKKEDKIVGIWTERDLLYDSNQAGFDPDNHLIGEHMTTSLHTARHDASIDKIKEMFLGLFIRHIIIEKDGDYIGLLSIGDVLRASLIEQDRQIKELNKIASWEYYENWGWHRKNR